MSQRYSSLMLSFLAFLSPVSLSYCFALLASLFAFSAFAVQTFVYNAMVRCCSVKDLQDAELIIQLDRFRTKVLRGTIGNRVNFSAFLACSPICFCVFGESSLKSRWTSDVQCAKYDICKRSKLRFDIFVMLQGSYNRSPEYGIALSCALRTPELYSNKAANWSCHMVSEGNLH